MSNKILEIYIKAFSLSEDINKIENYGGCASCKKGIYSSEKEVQCNLDNIYRDETWFCAGYEEEILNV